MSDETTPLFQPGVPNLDAPALAVETIACGVDGCAETFTTTGKGPGTAGFKVGRHRWQAHKVKGDTGRAKKTRAKANEPTDEDRDAQPVLSIVREATAQVSGSGAPSATAIANGLGRGLGLLSVAAASYAVETDPNIADGPQGDITRQYLLENLALSERSAVQIVRPIAKIVAPTTLNKKYGRGVIENVDALASVAELAKMGMFWRKYLAARRAGAQPVQNEQGPSIPIAPAASAAAGMVASGPQPAAPGAAFPTDIFGMPVPPITDFPQQFHPVVQPNGQVTSPGMAEGTIVTPEMVLAMRAARG